MAALDGTMVNTLVANDPALQRYLALLAQGRGDRQQLLEQFTAAAQGAQQEADAAQGQFNQALAAPIPQVSAAQRSLGTLVGGAADMLSGGTQGSQLAEKIVEENNAAMLRKRGMQLAQMEKVLNAKLDRANKLGDLDLVEKTLKERDRLYKEQQDLADKAAGLDAQRENNKAAKERNDADNATRRYVADKNYEGDQLRANAARKNALAGAAGGLMLDNQYRIEQRQLLGNLNNQNMRARGIKKDDAINRLPLLRSSTLSILRSELDKPALTVRRWAEYNDMIGSIKTPTRGGVWIFGNEQVPIAHITRRDALEQLKAFYGGDFVLPQNILDELSTFPAE